MMNDREVANGPRVIESSNYPISDNKWSLQLYTFITNMDWYKWIFWVATIQLL